MSAETILRNKVIEKAWEDPSFKEQLLSDPKAALQAAFGIVIPDSIEFKVLEEKPNQFYLVLPPNPSELLNGKAEPVGIW